MPSGNHGAITLGIPSAQCNTHHPLRDEWIVLTLSWVERKMFTDQTSLMAIYMSLEKCLFTSSVHFFNWIFFLLFCCMGSYQIYGLQLFSPTL